MLLQNNGYSEEKMCACVLVAQSYLTLCNPMDCSQPGSSVHGISQARILEWVAISFFRRSSQLRDQTCVSCIADRFFTVWVTREAQTKDNQYKFIYAVNNIRLRKIKYNDGRDGWRKVMQERIKNTIEHLCTVERFSHGSEKTTTVISLGQNQTYSYYPKKWKWKLFSRVRLFATAHSPQNSPGQNTGVGSLSLLQGNFPTQGSNAGLPQGRQILYQLSHKRSPEKLILLRGNTMEDSLK